jgi:2-dehydropantoate 2-reductase
MKILVVGAGAIGGYFGGRLQEKGEDVTFLVREKRKQQLEHDRLIVDSVHGNMKLVPKLLVSGKDASGHFDVVLLSTKSYHLKGAIESIRPYVSEGTVIVPLLNGISHLSDLTEAFGEGRVLGGLCFIETTLDANGKVIQTSPIHDLVFGERSGVKSERIEKLAAVFSGTKANFRLSEQIEQEMWHKYLFIATLSGATSLFRSPIGPIRDQAEGLNTLKGILHEAEAIMRKINAPLAEQVADGLMDKLLSLNDTMKSSLQRDMEKQLPTEADHFFGYLLEQAAQYDLEAPIIKAVYSNIKIYESLND